MTLSEAIRLGSTLTGQAFGQLIDFKGNTCALGGAALAAGIRLRDYDGVFFWARIVCLFPCLQELVSRYELPFELAEHLQEFPEYPLVGVIQQLDDALHWTRERIAQWVVDHDLDGQSVEVGVEKSALELAATLGERAQMEKVLA
jgi:hypothetical protein